jgi:ABC-type nickel/cobalt efflux system permease component RcnA
MYYRATTQQHNNTTTQQHNNTTTQQHNNTTTQQHNKKHEHEAQFFVVAETKIPEADISRSSGRKW